MISLVDDTALWRGNGGVLDSVGPVEVRRAFGRDLMVTRSPWQRTEIHGEVVASVQTCGGCAQRGLSRSRGVAKNIIACR